MKKRKRIRMVVEVSCPVWLTAAQARKEVKALINHQAFWGHHNPGRAISFNEIEIAENNFRAMKVGTVPRV